MIFITIFFNNLKIIRKLEDNNFHRFRKRKLID